MLRACRRRHAHKENHQQRPRPPTRPHTAMQYEHAADSQFLLQCHFPLFSLPLAYSFGVSFYLCVCVCFPDVGHKCYSIFMTNLHTTQSKERKAKKKIKHSGEKAANASKWKSCQHNQIAVSIGLGGGESIGEVGRGGSERGGNGNQKRKRALNSFAGQHVWIPELFAHAE